MKYTVAILAIFAFASCKKEYTCRCTDKDGHEVANTNKKISKKDLDSYKTLCIGNAVGYNAQYPLISPITCSVE